MRSMDSALILRRDPSLPTHKCTPTYPALRGKMGPGASTSGVEGLKEDTVPDFDFFFGLTLSASKETEMMTTGTSRGTGRSIVSTG